MRVECSNRGLITYGDSNVLKTRLEKDEAHGLFRGNLATMSDEYLRDGCTCLSIPSRDDRQTLIRVVQKYNAYKRQHVNGEETEGGFNNPLNSSFNNLEGFSVIFFATGTLEKARIGETLLSRLCDFDLCGELDVAYFAIDVTNETFGSQTGSVTTS